MLSSSMDELQLELNRVAQLFGDKLWSYPEFGEFLLSNISKGASPGDNSNNSIISNDYAVCNASCWLGLKIELKRMKLLFDESQRSLRQMQSQFLSLCGHMGDVQNELAEHKQQLLLSSSTLPPPPLPLPPPTASLGVPLAAAVLHDNDDDDLRWTNNTSPLSFFLEEEGAQTGGGGGREGGGGSLVDSDSDLRVVSVDDVHASADRSEMMMMMMCGPLMSSSINSDNTSRVSRIDTDDPVLKGTSSSLPLVVVDSTAPHPHPSSSPSPSSALSSSSHQQLQLLSLDQLLGMCGSSSEVCSQISQALEEALQPQDAQLHYRNSVVALMKRHIRSALNCESYEVGLLDLHCFLTEDPLRVSAILCRYGLIDG